MQLIFINNVTKGEVDFLLISKSVLDEKVYAIRVHIKDQISDMMPQEFGFLTNKLQVSNKQEERFTQAYISSEGKQ